MSIHNTRHGKQKTETRKNVHPSAESISCACGVEEEKRSRKEEDQGLKK